VSVEVAGLNVGGNGAEDIEPDATAAADMIDEEKALIQSV
jgi:hypothetical protein